MKRSRALRVVDLYVIVIVIMPVIVVVPGTVRVPGGVVGVVHR